MNKDIFEGKWKQVRGYVKEKWGRLTDDEVDTIQGKCDRLAGLLQQHYGYARDRADKEIESWFNERADVENWKAPTGLAALLLALLLPAMAVATACQSPDAALTAKVKTKMAADSTVPAMQIEVDTNGKVVTLIGNVDTKAQKERAIEIARHTGGVVDVIDMISVRTGPETGNAPDTDRSLVERVDDAAITVAVKKRLLDDPDVKGLRIDVDTRDGIVYLTGDVRSNKEKARAVELARETKHVRNVQANITVTG